jgi:hypothetical protein
MARRSASNKRRAVGVNDVTPPVISGLAASSVTATTATITLATDELATSQLQYANNSGFTGATTVSETGTLKTSHSYGLTGLSLNTTYYFRVRATDTQTNQSAYTSTENFVTTGGGAAWVDSGSISGVSNVQLRLDATFESINIEVLFTEAVANTVTAATVEYRASPGGSTLTTLPLWLARPVTGSPGAYGKVLLLTDNTAYDVRITMTDGSATLQKAGTITTRHDNLTPAGSISFDYYLDAVNGNDTTGTGAIGAPWKTIAKAVSTAANDSDIRMAPGWYNRYSGGTDGIITKTLRFYGQNPAVTSSGGTRTATTASGHAIIYGGAMTGPSGATETHLKGTPGSAWTVYDAPNGIYRLDATVHGIGLKFTQMLVSSTALGSPIRVPEWKRATDTALLADWITLMTTNLNQMHFGFWKDASGNVYVKLPVTAPSSNPNNCYVSISSGNLDGFGLRFSGPNCRVSGIAGQGMDALVQFEAGATFGHVDHCLHYSGRYAVRIKGTTPGTYGSDHVIEDNLFLDTMLWRTTGAAHDNVIDWAMIKNNVTKANGTLASPNRMGETSESTAISMPGGAKRVVIRNNTIRGWFNGIASNNSGYDRYANYGGDWHDNLIEEIGDDPFEPEQATSNLAIWNNRTNHSVTIISLGPVWYGPVYFFRNACWQAGLHGIPTSPAGGPGGGKGLKYTGPSMGATMAPSRWYCINNTFWVDTIHGTGTGTRLMASAGGGLNLTSPYLRNNIFRSSARVWEWKSEVSKLDEDYNLFVTGGEGTSPAVELFLLYGGTEVRTADDWDRAVSGYRALYTTTSGRSNAYSNKLNGVTIATDDVDVVDVDILTDPENGDLTLAAGTNYARDAGVTIPNISPSASPDLGYEGQ